MIGNWSRWNRVFFERKGFYGNYEADCGHDEVGWLEDLVEMMLFHCYNEKECRAGRMRMDDERGVKRGGNAEKETSHWD